VRNPLLGDSHRLACAGIAPNTGRPTVDRKAAKPTDFDTVPTHQSITHRIQNRLNGEFGITVSELVKLRSQGFY
jgi:hypothetical protein